MGDEEFPREPHEVKYDWEDFDRRMRELLAEFAPVTEAINEDDEDGDPIGIKPPFFVGDFLVAAVFEDADGNVYTSHFKPNDARRYRMRGLITVLDEVI